MSPRSWKWLLLLTVGVAVWAAWPKGGAWPAGMVVAPDEPEQGPVIPVDEQHPWVEEGFSLFPQASYRVTARILSIRWYSDDPLAPVLPVDVALGWGVMSDTGVLQQLDIDQSGRWYAYRWSGRLPPAPYGEIIRSSANTHLSPDNEVVAHQLSQLRAGDRVTLTGWLVDIRTPQGQLVQTSMRRDDTGAGACEILRVESVKRFPAP